MMKLLLFYFFAIHPVPAPSVHSFSPTSGKTGTVVTVYGSHFTGVTAVAFGNTSASQFTVVSDTVLTAVVGTGNSGSVILTGPGGMGSQTYFTYFPAVPRPSVISFSPDSAATGDTVTIEGLNLTPVDKVFFGSTGTVTPAASFKVVSDSLIKAVVGTGSSGYIIVQDTGGTGSSGGFTYLASPLPVVHSLSPDTAAEGATVTIRGVHFTGAVQVIFGNNDASSFTVLSDSLITAVVGTGNSGSLIVETPSGEVAYPGFVFIEPPAAPLIYSFTPTSGSTGTTVVVRGANLRATTAVTFGDVAASSFSIVSDTILTAVVGAGATGAVDLYNGPYSLDTLDGFTFITDSLALVPPSLAVARADLKLYPNPVTESRLTIAVPGTAELPSQLMLADLSGRVLKVINVDPHVSQVQVITAGFAKGICKLIWSDGKNHSYRTILVL